MTIIRERGTDAPSAADPDEMTLICRSCGQPFTGRVGWRPVCWSYWEETRGHRCRLPCPPCQCPPSSGTSCKFVVVWRLQIFACLRPRLPK